MTERATGWRYACLTLVQPRWPGRSGAVWVARVGGAERFRTSDPLAAMDRLGAEGWELVTPFPEAADRPASFWFKAPLPDPDQTAPGPPGGPGRR